tara:strand:- start:4216 stop:5223 length:1008 start_codon:yes stop_codon:yes gene_type:complete
MNSIYLKRREFIRLGVGVSILGLIGCSRGTTNRTVLRASTKALPREFLATLPSLWKFEKLDIEAGANPYESALEKETDLLAIQDGWLDILPSSELLTIDLAGFLPFLSAKAKKFNEAFSYDFDKKLLPIGLTPWVMLFRNGEPWLETAKESWEVLLDPRLNDQIILPNSPRLIIEIAEKIGNKNNLKKLRKQVKAYDDMNGINWITSGKARVAVLPLNRCIDSLIKDHRLSIALPNVGSPLNWTVLVRPASSQGMLPSSWFKELCRGPMLRRLLNKGWILPIPYEKFSKEKFSLRQDLSSVIIPSKQVWDNCWSLLPLTRLERKDLTERWIDSSP